MNYSGDLKVATTHQDVTLHPDDNASASSDVHVTPFDVLECSQDPDGVSQSVSDAFSAPTIMPSRKTILL